MNRVNVSEEYSMGWLALRVLNQFIDKIPEIPKDLKTIKESDELVQDIGFVTGHTYTEKEIVNFFHKLGNYATPFSNPSDHEDCIREAMEIQDNNSSEEGHSTF